MKSLTALEYAIWRLAFIIPEDSYGNLKSIWDANHAAAELERLQQAAVDLFQACSKLTIDDMDKIEAELNAMSAALKP